jgi:hypothetical protein
MGLLGYNATIRKTPAAAVEALMGLPLLHLKMEAKAQKTFQSWLQ